MLHKVKVIGVPIRMIPVYAFLDGIPRDDGVCGNWFRPEDIDAYSIYVDTVEFGAQPQKREQALDILQQLSDLGYLSFELDAKTKLLTYRVTDYELDYCGAPCDSGAVYATPGYGFLCVPRSITERLVAQNYIFNEADAWLDLWCHTVSMDPHNAFSFFAPVCQYGKTGVFLTLEKLGQRWRWEKTKVWRFLQKHRDVFTLYRLPGSLGCLVFNTSYHPAQR